MNGFVVIILSALTHALWNIFLKQAKNKYIFNFYMHGINVLIFTVCYPVFFKNYMYFDMNAVVLAFIGAVFFSGYHISLSTSYRYADASTAYPITTTSPLFILIWGVVIFDEKLSLFGVAGIFVTVFGTLMLNQIRGNAGTSKKGVLFALLAAFLYSLGAIADKFGVHTSNMILYVYMMTVFMTSFLFVTSARRALREGFQEKTWHVLTAGVIVFVSFFSYRYGLTLIELSYASALRQVNALFAVVLGIIFLREPAGFRKIMGTVLIVAGMVLIRLGL